MENPKRIWWARPRKLCAMERPGGGGRSHRPERREAEIAYLVESGVRLVLITSSCPSCAVSCAARARWRCTATATRTSWRRCGAHLHEWRGLPPEDGLSQAAEAGLTVTPDAALLLGVDYEAVQPRSRMAASTSSGRSVTT